jgi:hypothetical protein
MGTGRRSNHDVCKSWGQALAALEIGQSFGNASCCDIESEYPIAVQMEHSLEPSCQVGRLAFGFSSTCLCNSILNL